MKKIGMIMLVILMSMAVLTGCTSETENVESDEVSETVSENSSEISEDILPEEVEEESAEEVSEEMVEEVDYSAEAVMALIDDVIAKYQYNDPEHIKALVIAANLDYITAEDLDTILNTYGYTMDELSDLYNACASDNAFSMGDTISYYKGAVDSISPEQEYDNRIALADVMINESDKQFATSFDETARLASHYDADADMILVDMTDSEYSTSGEQVVVNFAYACFYGPTMENPYATYQKTIE